MSERSSHRDVYEEKAQGGVGELRRGVEVEEFLRQEKRGNRHGGRLGDE